MFEVLSQKTVIMAPLAFIIYVLSAIALGWILYGLRGYKVWARRFGRYEQNRGYLPSKQKLRQDYGYVEYIPEVTQHYQSRYQQQAPVYYEPKYTVNQNPVVSQKPYYPTQYVPEVAPAVDMPLPGVHYSTKDDLKVVEGIGPKIEEILNGNGIHTWRELAQTPVENLRVILNKFGKQFQVHDPETWPYQAGLAEQGNWNGLESYQDHIYAGREVK